MKIPCANTYYLDRHLAEIDRQDAIDAAIENHIASLIDAGGEYDPYEFNNFSEGFGEISDGELAVIAGLMRLGHYEQSARLMDAAIKSYWKNLAKSKAEDLTKNCRYCFGAGCHKCEEP